MKLKTLAFIAASSAITLPAFAADPLVITAAGTDFLTQVANTATLNYKISGSDQTEITKKNTFYVDRKVVFSMTRTGDATVSIDANDDRTYTETYTVQNNSNAPIGIKLPADADLDSSTTAVVGGTTTSADAEAAGFYTLSKGDTTATTDALTITVTTVITNADISSGKVAYDLTITAVEPKTVASVTGDDINAGVSAVTAGDAIVITPASTEWNGLLLQTVGIIVDGDSDNSGRLRTESKEYTIDQPDVSLAKTALVIKDPITGEWEEGTEGNKPKAIPGATIRYSLVVTNEGKAAAKDIILTDDLAPLADRLTLTATADSSEILNGSGNAIVGLEAELSIDNLLTFSAVDVPAATFDSITGAMTAPGKITATFEVVIK